MNILSWHSSSARRSELHIRIEQCAFTSLATIWPGSIFIERLWRVLCTGTNGFIPPYSRLDIDRGLFIPEIPGFPGPLSRRTFTNVCYLDVSSRLLFLLLTTTRHYFLVPSLSSSYRVINGRQRKLHLIILLITPMPAKPRRLLIIPHIYAVVFFLLLLFLIFICRIHLLQIKIFLIIKFFHVKILNFGN